MVRQTPKTSSRLAVVATATLLVLLIVLGVLQYRWTGELGRAEQDRLRVGLAASTERFAGEFDRELSRVWLHFAASAAGDREARLVHLLAAWEETAPYPGMVRDVLLWRLDAAGEPRVMALAPGDRVFHEATVGPQVGRWMRRRVSIHATGIPLRRPGPPSILVPRLAAVVAPGVDFRRHFGGPPPGRSELEAEVLVRLDRDYLATELFPRLGERYMQAGDAALYRFGVLAGDTAGGPAAAGENAGEGARRDPFLYRSDAEFSLTDAERADAEAPLFRMLPPEALQRLSREVLLSRLAGQPSTEWTERTVAEGRQWGRRLAPLLAGAEPTLQSGAWRLVVRHRAGSLEAAVVQHRRRNLALGGGVLALLAAVVGLLVVSSRRAHELAVRRVEFVAGVSHELRTPLASIRSLGQNLADGIVEEPQGVREYGGLIAAQSARLTAMIEQVLAYSGSLAGQSDPERLRLEIGGVVREALERSRPVVMEAAVAVEVEIDGPLPEMVGDEQALRGAVENLIGNATKFGREGGWVGIRVTAEGERGARISVADRGPGVDPDEREKLFEPFYRGRYARRSQIPGSGLGLSLAQEVAAAHGGHIEVRDGADGGMVFSLVLPGRPVDA